MSDSTKNWILKEVLPLLVVVGGSVLWITNEFADLRNEFSEDMADLRNEFSEDIADVRERVASVEGKLDLLISGLDIQVNVASVPDRPE